MTYCEPGPPQSLLLLLLRAAALSSLTDGGGSMTLKNYCEQTSLHGWYYIIAADRRFWKGMWFLVRDLMLLLRRYLIQLSPMQIVTASIGVALAFVYTATEEFTKATVVTTIQSTTVPLSEVFFPAVTVCNINQVGNKRSNYATHPI